MRDSLEKDTEELLLSEEPRTIGISGDSWEETRRTPRVSSPAWQLRSVPILVLCLTNIATLTILFSMIPSTGSKGTCLALNHPPEGVAPSLAHLIRDPGPEMINVTFYPHTNPFRQRDSVETDKLWLEYTQASAGFIMIPRGEEARADIDPSRHAYIDRPDIGMVGYPVLPEAIHVMHCVDKLRQNLYYNIEHTRKHCELNSCVPRDMEEWDILHINHCLEILRRRVACTADLGIVPFMWYKNTGKLTGDNQRMHTCGGDYEAIVKFAAENGVSGPPLGAPNGLKPPEGQFILDDYD